jgi:hypothetical protein
MLQGSDGWTLRKERWAGAIDTVGGQTLANVCASASCAGTVVACGNAWSPSPRASSEAPAMSTHPA